jgi:hypothetical protein
LNPIISTTCGAALSPTLVGGKKSIHAYLDTNTYESKYKNK